MIKEQHLNREISIGSISIDIYPVGKDVLAIVKGGEKPHIGCTVLSIPRKSISGDGSASCTSSVINVIGHKDEELCRFVSESIATKLNATTVCSGGFHNDSITEEGIREVIKAVQDMTANLTLIPDRQ